MAKTKTCTCCWRPARFHGLCSTHDLELEYLRTKAAGLVPSELVWIPFHGELPAVMVSMEQESAR